MYNLNGMNMRQYICLVVGLFGGLAVSCVSDPLEGEQYAKHVVLIGSNDEYQEREVNYGGQEELFVSVYCGGTQAPESDVSVTLGEADQSNIDRFNEKNVLPGETAYEALPHDWYNISSQTGIIKAGERYVRIPVQIDADKIDADKLYMLPLKITNVEPYPVSAETDSVLLIKLKMVNDYSGSYTMSGSEYPVKADGTIDKLNAVPISVTRVLTAMDVRSVRFFHRTVTEHQSNLDANGIVLTVAENGADVTITPWNQLQIIPGSGKGTYTVENGNYGNRNRIFTIEYDYVNDSGETMRVSVMLKSTES